jgi:LVIVD repeat
MRVRLLLALAAVIGILATPLGATPPQIDLIKTWAVSDNMTALGYAERLVPVDGPSWNTDLAFWGDMVVQGSYTGFRLIDATYPSRPRVIVEVNDCAPNSFAGNQGDVAIYGNILSRSWNSNTPPSGSSCDGNPVPPGFEGLHIFDISNKANPTIVASVDLQCGSHTQTMIPDLPNNRLLVYVGSSSGTCQNFDIVEIPLSNPAGAHLLRQEPTTGHPCHDIGVILGSAMKLACAGGNSLTIYSLGGDEGGTLEDPVEMHHILPGIPSAGHSAAFTYDGKVVVFGWEPGGGVEPRCTPTGTVLPGGVIQTDDMKSYFFFSVETGELLGKFILPRDQSVDEVCTIHNYNVVPLKNKNGKPRYVLVSGNYSAGISVVDFTNPANAHEVAYADEPPLPDAGDGGDWSGYWYNGRIYESNQIFGLLIWRLDDPAVSTYFRTPFSNPQSQLFTID